MDPRFFDELLRQPFIVVLLVLVLIGGSRKMWVFGWQYDDAIQSAREAAALLREQTEALKETAQTSRATYELLKRTVDQRPGGQP